MSDWIFEYWGINPNLQSKILYTLIAIAVLLAVRFIILRFLLRQLKEVKERYFYARAVKITIGIILVIAIIAIWFSAFGSIATFVGLISAGLTIALKDLIVNAAGWLFIMARRPFGIGDRVQIGEYKGDVIDIRIFQFTINEIGNWVDADQSTGSTKSVATTKDRPR